MAHYAFQISATAPNVMQTHKHLVVRWVERNHDRIICSASNRVQTPAQAQPKDCVVVFRPGDTCWYVIVSPRNDMVFVEVVEAVKMCLERAGHSTRLTSQHIPRLLQDQILGEHEQEEGEEEEEEHSDEFFMKLLCGERSATCSHG